MTCDCRHYMQLVDTVSDYEWQDDSPSYTVRDNYECSGCGKSVSVDVTSDTICENPY